MFKKILVPLDGSKLAENALGCSEMMAKRFDAEVILFHTLKYASALYGHRTARRYLHRL